MNKGRVIILIILLLIFLAVILPFILNIVGINVLQYGSSVGDAVTSSASLIRSSDGGVTWKNASVSESRTSFPRTIFDITIHPTNPDVMFLGAKSSGLWKSTNAGVSWTKVIDAGRALSQTADVYRVGISHSSTTVMYLAAFQGRRGRVLKSEDGGVSFREMYFVPSDGYVISDVYVDPIDSNHIRSITGQGGVLDSRDGGRTWRVVKWFSEPLTKLIINPDFFSEEFVMTGRGKLFKTFDAGENWAELSGLKSAPGYSLENPAVSEEGRTITVTPFQFRGFSGFGTASIEALVADVTNFARLYIGATDGLYRSTDGGFMWDRLSVLIPSDALPVTAVATHPGNPQIIFAGARNQLHWSTDGGTNWAVETLPTSSRILGLSIHPTKPEVMFSVLGR